MGLKGQKRRIERKKIGGEKKSRKKREKNWKKVLTNEKRCGRIAKLSAREAQEPWKLNNGETEAECREIYMKPKELEQFLENKTLRK